MSASASCWVTSVRFLELGNPNCHRMSCVFFFDTIIVRLGGSGYDTHGLCSGVRSALVMGVFHDSFRTDASISGRPNPGTCEGVLSAQRFAQYKTTSSISPRCESAVGQRSTRGQI